MTETNDNKIEHRAVLEKHRREKLHRAIKTIHSLDHFRNTDQSQIQSDEGGR